MTKSSPESGSFFAAVLRDHVKANHGTQLKFSAAVGLHQSEISWFMNGVAFPTGKNMDIVAKDIGLEPETLQLLSRISVADAMNVVLDKIEQED